MITAPPEFEDADPPRVKPTAAMVKQERNKVNGVHHTPESFETARPLQLQTPIHPEAELLSCCLLDIHTLSEAIEAGLSADSFTTDARQTIFRRMVEIYRREHAVDTTLLVAELRRHKDFQRIGGYTGITESTPGVPSTLNAHSLIQTIRNDEIRREIIRIADVARARAAETADPDELLAELSLQFRPRVSAKPKLSPRPITDFSYPQDDDPGILLGSDDYLGRGGGFLFVSHAGAGKSSWIMDACMTWALGRPWMGIKSSGPLKSLIIQAEDSDRYIGKVFASFAHVHELDLDARALLAKNCLIIRLKGTAGPSFLAELRRLTELHQPDLVIINPLYIYADGDIGRSEFAQPFLLGLDAVNREEKFGYILVHHTGKPSPKTNGKRAEVEDWESVYMGFGSSYLANWPRCSALLEPVPKEPGRFMVKLGKGGYNAGVTNKVAQGAGFRLEPTTRIAIRHSINTMPVGDRARPVYYWEIDDTPPSPEDRQPSRGGGRPQKYDFKTYANVFPAKSSDGMELTPLHRLLCSNLEIQKKTLHMALQRWEEDGHVEIIRPQGRPMRYRAVA